MEKLSKKVIPSTSRPIQIMQFGEGNFLRAFVDWIIDDLNRNNKLNSNVVVVQPVEMGRVADLESQDGLYTLLLEGIDKGQVVSKLQVIDCLSDFINPYTQYGKFLEYAKSQDLKIIISNTTEAGIALNPNDVDFSKCPISYPGKLLALLKARYDYFKGDKSKGLAIIPCELIDYNGRELKRVLNELAKINKLPNEFIDWLNEANHFTSTLVDRIVPGYPKNQIEEIQQKTGYIDNSVVKGEIFHLWVLEKEPYVQKVFPANSSGLNVIFADDITPYKQRKVKILNGSHTALVPVAYLYGIDTVGEAVNEPTLQKFVKELMFNEVKPTIDLPENELNDFCNSILERFGNPFVRHELMSIALNSTTKFKTRLLPTLIDYVNVFHKTPNCLLFSFASLMEFYRGKRGDQDIELKDDLEYIERWKNAWESNKNDYNAIVKTVMSWTDIWDVDISAIEPNIVDKVATYLREIDTQGMAVALKGLLN